MVYDIWRCYRRMVQSRANIDNVRPDFKFGYTTRNHLLVDLDDTTLRKTLVICRMLIKEYPELGDCLITLSSEKKDSLDYVYFPAHKPKPKRVGNSYHLIFNNTVGFNKCYQIIRVLAGLSIIEWNHGHLRKYYRDMTLRTSHRITMEKVEPPPTPLIYIFNQNSTKNDNRIHDYYALLKTSYKVFISEFKLNSQPLLALLESTIVYLSA